MPPDLLVLADDLTGALEAGAKLGAAVGFELPASVIDTETRHVSPGRAYSVIHEILVRANAGRVYKKTDSTLRGNIPAEFSALADAYPYEPIHYIPAYPKMGRKVKDGWLYVHGVRTAPIPEMRQVILHEAETDDEVAAAVGRAGRIVCGPAAVADYLAPAPSPKPLPRIASCIVINGSLQEISALQIDHALSHGWRTAAMDDACSAIREWPWLILRVQHACAKAPMICEIVNRTNVDALMIFGGDTAYAIVTALGERTITPICEVLPGVPLSRLRQMHLISKAGGFGEVDVLTQILRACEAGAEPLRHKA